MDAVNKKEEARARRMNNGRLVFDKFGLVF